MKLASDFWKPINLLNLSIGILGLLFGFYFFKASQPTIRVGYIFDTELIAHLDDPTLALSKDGVTVPVRSLYRTKVGIWNAGSTPIESGSVRRPLTIEFSPNVKLIDANIEKISHNISSPILRKDASKVELDWRYFDPNFYFVIQLYHSTDDPPQISLRYVGDQEIATLIPKSFFDSRYYLVTAAIAIVGFFGLVSFAIWVSFRVKERLRASGELRVLGVKLSSSFVAGLVYWAIATIGLGAITALGMTGKFVPSARSIFDITVPAGISEIMPIDQAKPRPK